jgi:phage terminase small subunit
MALTIPTSNGNAVQNPLAGVANRTLHEMIRFAVEFGMTPRSRTKAERPKEVNRSKWAGLIA